MANKNPPNQFQPQNTLSKGNQGGRSRMLYDRLKAYALETYGVEMVDRLALRCSREEDDIALKASHQFFKLIHCGDPLPSDAPASSRPMADLCHQYALSQEDVQRLAAAQQTAVQQELTTILLEKEKTS